jgi:inner membrane protein
VDNITHAFVGAAMAECALPANHSARTRAMFMSVGVIAANAPDCDLFYTAVIEEPLGYLLHHRGHSHTVPGLAGLGLLIWCGLWFLRPTRRAGVGVERRCLTLIAAALLSHLLMDAANSYGTHLFYPLSSRWFYGDAVFVIEPWLWAILGTALASNAARVARVVIGLGTVLLIGALVWLGLLPAGMVAVIVACVGAAAIASRSWNRPRRAAAVLMTTAVVFCVMPGVSRVAKAQARRAVATLNPGTLVDVVSDANPGMPWCWAVLTLQKESDRARESLVAHRATLSLVPGIWPAASCPSARLSRTRSSDIAASSAIVWHRRWHIDSEDLRRLSDQNCRVRAWLQFGRVPYISGGRILDLRYETPVGQNFTPMIVDSESAGCPAYLTRWEPPRRDVLDDSRDRP